MLVGSIIYRREYDICIDLLEENNVENYIIFDNSLICKFTNLNIKNHVMFTNYYNNKISFLNSKIHIFEKLNVQDGDIVCFEAIWIDEGNICKYIYIDSNFIEIDYESYVPRDLMFPRYNINFWGRHRNRNLYF